MNVADWLVSPNPAHHANLRLIGFLHAWAGASAFRTWLPFLSQDIDAQAVALPSREHRFTHFAG